MSAPSQRPLHAPAIEPRELARAVRDACVEALTRAYEEASISGLCAEGAWEVALGQLRGLEADELLRRAAQARGQTGSAL